MTAPHDSTDHTGPYGHAAAIYWTAGWRGVLPLPASAKAPVPTGWTGAQGAWPSYADVFTWTEGPECTGNIALRLPQHVIGIDVDAYDGKPGAATLARLEGEHGPLPATWRATSRDDGSSGIRFFRVPEGLAWPGGFPGIEIIQHRHRYAVVWPSLHPEGRTYRWIDPAGNDVIGQVPHVDDLPDLPDAWVQGITRGVAAADVPKLAIDDTTAGAWLDARGTGEPCRAVQAALRRYTGDLEDQAKARHDVAMYATSRLAHLAAEGHTGVNAALGVFKTAWAKATADPKRAHDPAEWNRLLGGAVRIAAADPQGHADPCDNPFHGLLPDRPQEPSWTDSASPAPTASTTSAATTTSAGAAADSPSPTPSDVSPSGSNTATPASADDAFEASLAQHQALMAEVEKQRAQRGARRLLDDEEAAKSFRVPDWRPSLVEELAIPDEPVQYLVDRVFPVGSNVLLTAQFKAGKTSTVNHFTKCVVDHEPFLGEFDVTPDSGRVCLWNYEVDGRMMRRWLRDVGIEHPERVTLLNLRGYRVPVLSPRVEDWVVAFLKDHDISTWVVDPFARAFTGSGDSENDNTAVGAFLDALDVIKERAGVQQLILPTHTGRGTQEVGQERARGATRLDDWADVRWLLTIDDEGDRYFRATGRDVEVAEQATGWDEEKRRPYITGGSRRGKSSLGVEVAVLDACRLTPGIGLKALRIYVRQAIGKADSNVISEVCHRLEDQGRIRIVKGPPGSPTQHFLAGLDGLVGGAS